MSTRPRPVLVYDGDCAFCTRSVRLVPWLRANVEVRAWQSADLAALGLTAEQAGESVQWVGGDGHIESGHRAVAALLRVSRPPLPVLGRVTLLPGISWVAARAYAWVSANRYRLPGGTAACALPPEQRPGAERDQRPGAAQRQPTGDERARARTVGIGHILPRFRPRHGRIGR
ncbi:MAG: thiol-disulfide oxidoreductase DCC family protein [Jatrophihabitantaceae bacterium]